MCGCVCVSVSVCGCECVGVGVWRVWRVVHGSLSRVCVYCVPSLRVHSELCPLRLCSGSSLCSVRCECVRPAHGSIRVRAAWLYSPSPPAPPALRILHGHGLK